MSKRTIIAWCFALMISSAAPAANPTRVAPFYAVPAVGVWVQYRVTEVGPHGKSRTGRLRLSVVGRERHDGTPYHWIEMDRATTTQDGATVRKVRKFLIADRAFRQGPTWKGNVRMAYAGNGDTQPSRFLSKKEINRLLTMGFEGAHEGLHEARSAEVLNTPLGHLQTRPVTATAHHGNVQLIYRGWLTNNVPFGWAKFEVQEKNDDKSSPVIYRAEVLRSGTGAKTILTAPALPTEK